MYIIVRRLAVFLSKLRKMFPKPFLKNDFDYVPDYWYSIILVTINGIK